MERSVVITFVGPDRPGLVERIAETVAGHGGSWRESRLSRLAGQFAGIVEIGVPEDASAALVTALEALAEAGLSLVCVPGEAAPGAEPAGMAVLAFEVLGHDRPGIVREISHAFAGSGIGVIELASGVYPAPMSGESLFSADVVVEVPEDADLDALRDELDRIADGLGVDIDLVEEPGFDDEDE